MAKVDTFYRAKRAATLVNPLVESVFNRVAQSVTDVSVVPAYTVCPASGKLAGQGFDVICRGSIVAGIAGNLTLNLRVGLTSAGTLLATSGAIAIPGAGNYNFELRAEELVWDATSQTVRGTLKGHVAGILVNRAVVSNPIVGFDPNGSVDMQIIATALFGTSNAANSVTVTELCSATA